MKDRLLAIGDRKIVNRDDEFFRSLRRVAFRPRLRQLRCESIEIATCIPDGERDFLGAQRLRKGHDGRSDLGLSHHVTNRSYSDGTITTDMDHTVGIVDHAL